MTASTAGLEASSNSGGIEALPVAAAVAVNDAADACTNDTLDDGSHGATLTDRKSEVSWLGLCQGLSKAPQPQLASSTATPSLSEVSSSHGGLTPRGQEPSAVLENPGHLFSSHRASPARWADETESPSPQKRWADEAEAETNAHCPRFAVTGLNFDEQDEADEGFEQGSGTPATPNKRSRRTNRRRRARAEKAAVVAQGCNFPGSGSPGVHKDVRGSPVANRTAGGHAGIRNSVTVGDLLCMSPCQARSGRSPQSVGASGEEVGWFMPVTPSRAQLGPSGIMSTSPCGGSSQGHLAFGYEASSGYIGGGQSPTAYNQHYFGVPLNDGATAWGPSTPSRALAGHSGIVSTSPSISVEASARTVPPLPVGPVSNSATPLSSPCHALVGQGIISTSPASSPHTANATSASGGLVGQLMGNEVFSVDPAGSPSADALRSWLHASGLPSCADLTYQLQAYVPEAYED